MIDRFTRAEFEAALPHHKITREALWKPLGIVAGEWCYLVPVSASVGLTIRSSVGSGGVAADTGEDSIRLLIVRLDTMEPCGSKVSTYVTRAPRWRDRMQEQLRTLWRMAKLAGKCSSIVPLQNNGIAMQVLCPGFREIRRSRKPISKGRLFVKCDKCGMFEWAGAPMQKTAAKAH